MPDRAHTSARLYWENKTVFFAPFNVSIPVAVSAFPDELYQCPRSWAEKGGHFAAFEQPKLLVEELRAGLRSLRP